MKPWNYLLLLIVPSLVIIGCWLSKWWNFLVPVTCFIIYPLINLCFKSHDRVHADENHSYPSWTYRLLATVFVLVLTGLTVGTIFAAADYKVFSVSFIGLCLSVGIVNGVLGFTLAHELIHRRSRSEKLMGYTLLLQNNYLHYGIEHVWGHHVYACTPQDPVSARFNESLYSFVPRAISGTYLSAMRIAARKSLRRSSVKVLTKYQVPLFAILQCTVMFLIFLLLGLNSVIFFFTQSLIAIVLLHVADYLQHYGLTRNKTPGGAYEKLSAKHAWNTGTHNPVINLFQLENHADHHLHPDRSFEHLQEHEESPQHPAGYSFMVLIALIPPLWFRIMNERITTKRKKYIDALLLPAEV